MTQPTEEPHLSPFDAMQRAAHAIENASRQKPITFAEAQGVALAVWLQDEVLGWLGRAKERREAGLCHLTQRTMEIAQENLARAAEELKALAARQRAVPTDLMRRQGEIEHEMAEARTQRCEAIPDGRIWAAIDESLENESRHYQDAQRAAEAGECERASDLFFSAKQQIRLRSKFSMEVELRDRINFPIGFALRDPFVPRTPEQAAADFQALFGQRTPEQAAADFQRLIQVENQGKEALKTILTSCSAFSKVIALVNPYKEGLSHW